MRQAAIYQQHIVEVVHAASDCTTIVHDGQVIEVTNSDLSPLRDVRYYVGDRVRSPKGEGVVEKAIWHFKDAQPNYYLVINGKRSSKRYLASDLHEAASEDTL